MNFSALLQQVKTAQMLNYFGYHIIEKNDDYNLYGHLSYEHSYGVFIPLEEEISCIFDVQALQVISLSDLYLRLSDKEDLAAIIEEIGLIIAFQKVDNNLNINKTISPAVLRDKLASLVPVSEELLTRMPFIRQHAIPSLLFFNAPFKGKFYCSHAGALRLPLIAEGKLVNILSFDGGTSSYHNGNITGIWHGHYDKKMEGVVLSSNPLSLLLHACSHNPNSYLSIITHQSLSVATLDQVYQKLYQLGITVLTLAMHPDKESFRYVLSFISRYFDLFSDKISLNMFCDDDGLVHGHIRLSNSHFSALQMADLMNGIDEAFSKHFYGEGERPGPCPETDAHFGFQYSKKKAEGHTSFTIGFRSGIGSIKLFVERLCAAGGFQDQLQVICASI